MEVTSAALEAHGWWMWAAWLPVGFLLLATKRYLKGKLWEVTHCIHAALGHFVTIVTLVQGYKQLTMYDWQIGDGLHNWMGVLFCVLFLAADATGTATAATG